MLARTCLCLLACSLLHFTAAYPVLLPFSVLRIKQQVALRAVMRNCAQLILVRGTHAASPLLCASFDEQDSVELKLHPRPHQHANDVVALERRVERLEQVLQELMRALTTCDDMLLLEREGAKCYIADEGLAKQRAVKLVRTQLLDIMLRHRI